ncbi:O-antigen ligase family protein [Pelagibacterales bacterium SAG-MED09]|nr:O-antigen ligase family protein [Pelagibacterales bacterium SAG-MED09]
MFNIKKNKSDISLIVLFSILPISILSGNLFINLTIVIISLVFFYKLIRKEFNILYNIESYNLFRLLLFFFLSLCINLFFSNNIYLSYPRVIKIFHIIFFVLAFKFLIINYSKTLEKIYKFWSILFLIVIIDLIFEFFVGNNILGQSSIMPGRLGSFTGEESVIGNYFFGFCLITLSFIYSKSSNIFLNLSLAIFLIIISFLIGERANFIRTFLAIILFMFFVYKVSYKIKFLSIILSLILVYSVFLNINSDYKMRYFKQIKFIFEQNGLTKYLANSQYGSHRNVAKEIFFDNPIFGVGIKNFRIESANKKYDNLDHNKNHLRVSNHPHELYYEFLSETGLFGLICFLFFIISSIILSIKNYFKEKNIYQFSAIIFVTLSILPIIPTGSFLSTYTSSIFWINFAIMMGYYNTRKS